MSIDFTMYPTAERSIASEMIGKKVADVLGPVGAVIEFKEIYHMLPKCESSEDGTLTPVSPQVLEPVKVSGKVLMTAQFSTGEETETVLSDGYKFVPNNTLAEIASKLDGAEVSTKYFGMYYFGQVTKDNLTVYVSNSYGGVRAFEMAPSVRVEDQQIPVFLKLRQVHSGGLESFEFRMKESLAVANALQTSQGRIESILKEPMTEKEADSLTKLIENYRMPKKILENFSERISSSATNPIVSFADAISFVVDEIKAHSASKKFSVSLQIQGDRLVSDILLKSKASLLVMDALGVAEREMAAELSDDVQSHLKKSKSRFKM